MTFKNQLTKEQALQKLRHYCAYQERCHSEVKEKLYELGISKIHHDEITASLIEENYLNEERFAILFAGGKFRIKQWGRVKIKYQLKQKQVSEYSIKKALKQISEKDYLKTIQKHIVEKLKTLKGERDIFIQKRKLYDFLVHKGFEADIVKKEINKI